MFDFDPRDHDPRDHGDEWRDPITHSRDLDHERDLDHDHDRDLDRDRAGERDRDADDPRDVFLHGLDLPRGHERERVLERDRTYEINGDESRTLATVGAFRVVSERDLRDPRDASVDGRDIDLRHLRDEGLIHSVPLDERDRAVVLTERGRSLLEVHRRDRDPHQRQAFYSGVDKHRERTHDAQLYRAYLRAAERLRERDARILRVELDRELKREYQRFLQERNRDRPDSDGRPDRDEHEIEQWAQEHDLPYFDEQVHFPDVRIEYEDIHGDVRHEDLEVVTEHYRGGHSSAVARSGFSVYQSGRGGGGGGRSFDPRVAEEFL